MSRSDKSRSDDLLEIQQTLDRLASDFGIPLVAFIDRTGTLVAINTTAAGPGGSITFQSTLDATAAARGVPVESLDRFKAMLAKDVVHGPRGKIAAEWAARQCYIALGQFMAACAASWYCCSDCRVAASCVCDCSRKAMSFCCSVCWFWNS
mgnify:CR=1 FL=1